MKRISWILFLALFVTAPAWAQTGLLVRSSCSSIASPVTNATWCLQTSDGNLYVYNGSGYTQKTGSGTGGINQLTGDVTAGPGIGSQAATIAAGAVDSGKLATDAVTTSKITNGNVTLGKIANAAASSKLLGSGSSGSGTPYTELSVGSGLAISGTTLTNTGGHPSGSPNTPLFDDGGGGFTNGTRSGNTTQVVTTTGTQTSGNCVQIDANGNHVAASGACGIAGAGYGTIQDEGSNLTARTTMNFIGAGVTAADDSGNSRTNITIPGGASLTQGTLAGRGASSGTGVYEGITLGTNLSMSGTTLNAAGGSTSFARVFLLR